jgi:hypothetical protein
MSFLLILNKKRDISPHTGRNTRGKIRLYPGISAYHPGLVLCCSSEKRLTPLYLFLIPDPREPCALPMKTF